ncbi:hypothetical protein SAMN03159443_01006 [Pseudomonas sp. NFACC15-1]|nr:hypothetical protein SAMN03159443_01006 [Pseudomonas sp. NFACC15-1]SDW83037.1 hypothetical protein SAMN03159380_01273 [Pseudomonas sp. NFACC14]
MGNGFGSCIKAIEALCIAPHERGYLPGAFCVDARRNIHQHQSPSDRSTGFSGRRERRHSPHRGAYQDRRGRYVVQNRTQVRDHGIQ